VYSMTGWRIGYAAGPQLLIAAMKKIQSQSTSNPASISQVAAMAALNGDQACIKPMLDAFKQRHDFVVDRLIKINGIRCRESEGTFYAFPTMEEIINQTGNISNDVEFAEVILNDVGIAMVPGSAFGAEGYMRISYATDMDTLKEALNRLQKKFGPN